MQKLTAEKHSFLTENILKTLAQNHIVTISDFLQEDTEKLSIISKLSLPQLLDIRNYILLKYSAPLVNSKKLFSADNKKIIPTFLECLDTALDGGLPVGHITEVCGLAGSGKTQLCFQLAINCAKKPETSVLYIDTKGDFSAIRIQKILDVCGYNLKQMAAIMFKIKVAHVWCMEDVIQLINKVKDGAFDNLELIILDSLPCLMFQHLGDDNKVGLKFLNELVNLLRFVSKKFSIAVVCVNIQTRWLDQDISDIDVDEEPALESKEAFTERRNRCLGKYWQHIPSVLLLLEKSERHENKEMYKIQVQIYKSRLPKLSQHCILKLNEMGVNSIKSIFQLKYHEGHNKSFRLSSKIYIVVSTNSTLPEERNLNLTDLGGDKHFKQLKNLENLQEFKHCEPPLLGS